MKKCETILSNEDLIIINSPEKSSQSQTISMNNDCIINEVNKNSDKLQKYYIRSNIYLQVLSLLPSNLTQLSF